jgi:hypothetical protein
LQEDNHRIVGFAHYLTRGYPVQKQQAYLKRRGLGVRSRIMRAGLAFFAGVIGGAVMAGLLMIARSLGFSEMNMPLALGTMVTQTTSRGTLLLGFVMHLVISGLIALVYAAGFEAIRRSNWWLGVIGGMIHVAIGGLFLWALPAFHPAIPDVLPAPGPFGINFGATSVAGFIVLHLIYGAIVGGIYRPVHVRAQPEGEPVSREYAVGAERKYGRHP